jgi:flavin-binding protein dodecin
MSVAKITEISSTSEKSFDDAVRIGLQRAATTLKNVTGAWVSEMKVDVQDGEIVRYRVNMRLTFILE